VNEPEARSMSVVSAQDHEILTDMIEFYSNPQAIVLDVTANARKMWKGVKHALTEPRRVFFTDVDHAMSPDVACDFRALPFVGGMFDVVVWDPPHLPSAAASEHSGSGSLGKKWIERYGLGRSLQGDNVSGFFVPFLHEALRVLAPEGLIFAKIKDFVHNHRYQWTLVDFIQAVRSVDGLTPCDLRINRHPSAGNLKSSKWEKAHHVRNAHCWWVVVRKGRCESKAKKTGTT
jgi:hypothetical protein